MTVLATSAVAALSLTIGLLVASFFADGTNSTRESFSTAGNFRAAAALSFLIGLILIMAYGGIHANRKEERQRREECTGVGILYGKTTE